MVTEKNQRRYGRRRKGSKEGRKSIIGFPLPLPVLLSPSQLLLFFLLISFALLFLQRKKEMVERGEGGREEEVVVCGRGGGELLRLSGASDRNVSDQKDWFLVISLGFQLGW